MDATALYPSMIRQNNISFNTFFGKIIDPTTYKFINLLIDCMDNGKKLPPQIYSQIGDFSKKYARRSKAQNMGKTTQIVYFITVYLIHKLINSKRRLTDIFNNSCQEEYIILKNYFITLIDLITDIVDKSKEYNTFAYNYLLNNEFNSDYVYIIENINEPNICIKKILSENIDQYLKSNNVCLSLSGCLFYTHEKEIGLFSDFLKTMKSKRNEYKAKRNTFKEGSEDYIKYDRMQLAVKILMNTTYGLFGLSSYRYSHKELAKAITIQGRLALKISQIVGESVLQQIEHELGLK